MTELHNDFDYTRARLDRSSGQTTDLLLTTCPHIHTGSSSVKEGDAFKWLHTLARI